MTFKDFIINYTYVVSITLAIIYGIVIIYHYFMLAVKSIKKYIMFRRYRYLTDNQLRNIDYGHFSKSINNRTQAMRNYVFLRDTWPYMKYIHCGPMGFKNFEDWIEWVYNNYYEDNLPIIQCLEDIIEGKTNEELIKKTDMCITRINKIKNKF